MARPLLAALAAMAVLIGSTCAADDKATTEKNPSRPTNVTISKIDARKGEITVKYTDAQGKAQEKTFHLAEDVRLLDETGRVVKIDVFESGQDALIVESAGKLSEVRRLPLRRTRSLSDAVQTLIEMNDCQGCTEEVQKIYNMLRKLDTKKDGKIDPQALKAAADHILQDRVNEIFNRLDTNKDGKISREEARGLIKQDFDRIDANKDGFIDRDELLKAARQRHEQKAAESKAGEKENK
jgi:Ca2+-binding EF-hand superfamily protein